MKKLVSIKSISLCLIAVFAVSLLTACSSSPTMDELAGIYTGSYTYEGSSISVAIILLDDGTYAQATYRDGVASSSESGDYEIDGSKVYLYNSDSSTYHGIKTTYKYKDGTLSNNGHKFTKESAD